MHLKTEHLFVCLVVLVCLGSPGQATEEVDKHLVDHHAVNFFSALLGGISHLSPVGSSGSSGSLIEVGSTAGNWFDKCKCRYGDSWRDPRKGEFRFPSCPAFAQAANDEEEPYDVSLQRIFTVEWGLFPAFNPAEPNPQLVFVITPLKTMWTKKVGKERTLTEVDFDPSGLELGAQEEKVRQAVDVILDSMEGKDPQFRLALLKRISQAAGVDGILRETKSPNYKKVAQLLARLAMKAFEGAAILVKTTVRGVVCVLARTINSIFNTMRQIRAMGARVWAKTKTLASKAKSGAAKMGQYMKSGAGKLKLKLSRKKKSGDGELSPTSEKNEVFLQEDEEEQDAVRRYAARMYRVLSGEHEGVEVDDAMFEARLSLLERAASSAHIHEQLVLKTLSTLHSTRIGLIRYCVNDENLRKGALKVAVNIEFPSISKFAINAVSGNWVGAITGAIPEILASIVPIPFEGKIDHACRGSNASQIASESMDAAREEATDPEKVEEYAEESMRSEVGAVAAVDGDTVAVADDVAPHHEDEDDEVDLEPSVELEREAFFETSAHLFDREGQGHLKTLDEALLQLRDASELVEHTARQHEKLHNTDTRMRRRGAIPSLKQKTSAAGEKAKELGGKALTAAKNTLDWVLDICDCDYEDSWSMPTEEREWKQECPAEQRAKPMVTVSRVVAIEWELFPTFALGAYNPILSIGLNPTEHLVEATRVQMPPPETLSKSDMTTPKDIAANGWKWAVNKVKRVLYRIFEKGKLMLSLVFKGLVCALYQVWDEFKALLSKAREYKEKVFATVKKAPQAIKNGMVRVGKFMKTQATKVAHFVKSSGAAAVEAIPNPKRVKDWVKTSAEDTRVKGVDKSAALMELAGVIQSAKMTDSQWNEFLETAEREFLSVRTHTRMVHNLARAAVHASAKARAKVGIIGGNCMTDETLSKGALQVALNVEFPNFPVAVSKLLLSDFAGAAAALVPELLIAFVPVQLAVKNTDGSVKMMDGKPVKAYDSACLQNDLVDAAEKAEEEEAVKTMEELSEEPELDTEDTDEDVSPNHDGGIESRIEQELST